MRRVGLARVSSNGQKVYGNSLEDQINQIKAKYPDVEIVQEAFSAKEGSPRPIFEKLIEELEPGDMLVVTKLDRFSRSVREGTAYIEKLLAKNVAIHILTQGVIEDTPVGRLIFNQFLGFAQYERDLIFERTQAGKAIARLNPDYKEGRPRIPRAQRALALEQLASGKTYKQVAEATGISKSTLQRIKAEQAGAAGGVV